MTAEKTVSISFRVTPRFKELLEQAAAKEHRSQINMLEVLLYEHCRNQGIEQAVRRQRKAVGESK
ncbi:hypothetical protein LZ009_09495 [Ramlibacter sp. XY19]|uniref:hypothetical protein n=1 Tax=Ramlibacter paludis TaxID=2908000 RepID=UPI0023DBF842|nr:hypothetical protein [Ramlibacter paludis]MCG2593014.1 hypothetical protein [Ramlibacter paludis]